MWNKRPKRSPSILFGHLHNISNMIIPGLEIKADDQELPWQETQVPGVHWLPLHLTPVPDSPGKPPERDPNKRSGGSVLIRMAPGSSYGAHRHLGPEEVLVLRGGYRDELGEYSTGRYVHYPAGSSHTPVALGDPEAEESHANPACILFAVASGGIELLGRDES